MLMFTPAAAAPPGSAVVALAALVAAKLPVFAKLTLCATRKKPLPVCGQCVHSVWCAGRMVHSRMAWCSSHTCSHRLAVYSLGPHIDRAAQPACDAWGRSLLHLGLQA